MPTRVRRVELRPVHNINASPCVVLHRIYEQQNITFSAKFLQPDIRTQHKEHDDRIQVYSRVSLRYVQCQCKADATQCKAFHYNHIVNQPLYTRRSHTLRDSLFLRSACLCFSFSNLSSSFSISSLSRMVTRSILRG